MSNYAINTAVGEAMGMTKGILWWRDKDGKQIVKIADYNPSENIQQALDFAFHVRIEHNISIDISFWYQEVSALDPGGIQIGQGQFFDESCFAIKICETALDALEIDK